MKNVPARAFLRQCWQFVQTAQSAISEHWRPGKSEIHQQNSCKIAKALDVPMDTFMVVQYEESDVVPTTNR